VRTVSAACRKMQSRTWCRYREALQSSPAPAAAGVLPEARGSRSFVVDEPCEWCCRSRSETCGDQEWSGPQDLSPSRLARGVLGSIQSLHTHRRPAPPFRRSLMIARWICCQHPVPAAVAQPRVGYDSRLAGVADLSHVGLMQEAVVRARIESRLKQDA
jgi:hypothetical protein